MRASGNFVIGVRDKKTDNFVIEANGDGPTGQLVGEKAGIKALKEAAEEHGVRNVELFELWRYRITA